MAVTETWKNYSIDAVFNGIAVPVTTFYVGLGTASFAVGADDVATGELTGAGYLRQKVEFLDFVSPQSTSTNEMRFAASADWPPVSTVFIANAFQGGRVIAYNTVTAKQASSGDIITVKVGGITLY